MKQLNDISRKSLRWLGALFGAGALLWALSGPSWASAPNTMTYQGRLKESGAETVHEDGRGALVRTTHLRDYLEGEDQEARFVLVTDPSTERRYALRVPPG